MRATTMRRSEIAIATILQAREGGATLRQAAKAAGVHVATVCRWENRDPTFREALREAACNVRIQMALAAKARPPVRWRRDCPLCKAKVVVRTANGMAKFWRCGRWPSCSWASWRPRAPRNCGRCDSPCYWSHSRKSIACSGCKMRIMAH
jgi:hypothetical protein